MPCFVYRNESVQQPENKFLKVVLKGEGNNKYGVGTKVTVHYNNTIAYQKAISSIYQTGNSNFCFSDLLNYLL